MTQPWMVPVPVRRSTFTPIHRRHAALNVEVDLSRLPAFSTELRPIDDVLHADLQINPDVNVAARLGSGRSGFYRGHYLKGVGRTTLAGSWNGARDLYHRSGMLLPSAAIREHLVSAYLEALGRSHVVTPCDGLLFRSLAPRHRTHAERTFRADIERHGREHVRISAVDARFQAISVKRGGFSRLSNFGWWLSSFPQVRGAAAIASFFGAFARAVSPSDEAERDDELDAAEIVARFDASVDRGVEHLLEAWKVGIAWGSLHNNFTADGRFLDLETPLVLETPVFGLLRNALDVKERTLVVDDFAPNLGGDALVYLYQVKLFVDLLAHRLAFLCEHDLCSTRERQFVAAFVQGLRRTFGPRHASRSATSLRDRIVPTIVETLDLDRKEARLVGGIIERNARSRPSGKLVLHRVDFPHVVHPEPAFSPAVFVPGFMRDRLAAARATPPFAYNAEVSAAESTTDLDELLATLKKATRKDR